MKIFRHIFWFIIPTILITALLLVLTFVPQSDFPKFVGPQNYFKLFINDPLFIQAMFNSFIKPFIIAFAVGFFIFILKLVIFKNTTKKWMSPLYYAILFIISSYVFHKTSNFKAIFGLPQEAYSAGIVAMHISDIPAKLHFINIPAILVSMQIGIFICLILWLVNKFLSKFLLKQRN
jgi:hypothetical protein